MTSTTKEFALLVEACEPDDLREDPRVASGLITFSETGGGMNCPEIEVYCADEAILLDFIYDGWVGDNEHGDLDWFRWLAGTIREVGIDATTRNEILSRIQKIGDVETRSRLLADLENASSDSQLEELSEDVAEAASQDAAATIDKAGSTSERRTDARSAVSESMSLAVSGWRSAVTRRDSAGEAAFTVGGVAVEAEAVYQADADGEPMDPPVREILVHLNVVLPASDERQVEEIVALLDGAIEVGLSGEDGGPLTYTIPMAEEV